MSKLTRVTGKLFGETASATGDANNGPYIGQFGSAKLGTYNGTTDIATIQGLAAWSNGWIDAVTPNNQYPPLPERTGVDKVLSYQQCYLLQQGIPEWDSATDYHTNGFCSQGGVIYYSLVDDNVGHNPSLQEGFWQPYQAEADHYLVTAYINGSTWYRLYSDGWIEQGGYVATSATDMSWGQPTLSANGTLGGNSFAVAANSEHITGGYSNYAWKAFDKNDSTMWTAGNNNSYPYTVTIYNPTPLKVSSILMSNRTDVSYTATSGSVLGSNDNSSYTTLCNWTNSTTGKKARWTINVSSSNYYKYYKISIATATYTSQYTTGAMQIDLTATYQGSGSNGVIFPISFSDTNYTFTLGFQSAAGSNVYISSKTKTGFQLSNASSGQVAWYACGY